MSNPYIVTYTGNGSQTDFQVPSTYIRQAHVSVSVGGILTSAYVWHTSSIVRLDVAPGNGVEVVIIDQAPGTVLNVYSGNTGLSALSLNENFRQSVQLADFAFNAAKDIVDGNIPAGTITGDMLVNGAVTAAKTSAGVQASLGKADSATQLASTPRTLWGRLFDASANISGNLNNVGNIFGSDLIAITSAEDTSLFLRAPGTGNVIAEAQGTGSVQLRADAGQIRFYNGATTFYTTFSSEALTQNRALIMANGTVTLTPGTMVPTTGAGATGTWSITAENVTNAARVSPGHNDIGAYNNLFNDSGVNIPSGTIADGADLLPAIGNTSGVWVPVGAARTGTWRAMSGTQVPNGGFGLFQRIT